MSDNARQSLGDKAAASMKPDNEKTYVEQATDYVKGSLDNLASGAQPQSEKSTTQKIGDAVSGGSTNRDAA